MNGDFPYELMRLFCVAKQVEQGKTSKPSKFLISIIEMNEDHLFPSDLCKHFSKRR